MADQKITFLAEMPGGTFRQETLTVTPDGLEHRRKRHLYDNEEDCVFPVIPPHPLASYNDLFDPPDPPQISVPEKWVVIGEYDGMFPYSTHVIHDWGGLEHRQERRTMLFQIGLKRASAANARAALENPFANALIVGAAAVAALMVMIVATALLFNIFGNQSSSAAAALPFLLGSVAMGRKRRTNMWSVYLYDTVRQRKLHYSLPFSEVAAHIPEYAWRFPSLAKYHWIGLLAGLAFPVLIATVLISRMSVYVFFWVTGAMILMLPFALLGWKVGPWIMKNYVWWCRPYVKLYRGQKDNGEILLQPVAYTNLTGVDPDIWESIVEERYEELEEAFKKAGVDALPPKPNPIINRASDAWNCKYSPLHKEYANHIPWSLAQKLQVGSLAVLILGTIGLSFFIIMALQGG